jgi:hypothetical protein
LREYGRSERRDEKTREEMKAAKDDVKKVRSWNLEDEALDGNNWKTSSGETMDLP